MFTFCPNCASRAIAFESGRVFHCPDCGFTYYHNVCAATACVISTGGRIIALVRGKEPAKGKLHLPGGFVDVGEGLIDGARRECREEIGYDPGEGLRLFASFPNIYPYKNISYNTCDCFFTAEAPGLSPDALVIQKSEIAGLRFLALDEINLDEFAFPSVRRALETFCRAKRASA